MSVAHDSLARDRAPKTIESCVICLEPISERAITNCNHTTFDFICLVSWLQEHATCPLCKSPVTRVEYDWRSPEDYLVYTVPQPAPKSGSSTPTTNSAPSHRAGWRGHPLPRRPRTRRPQAPIAPDVALLRRRFVYRHQLFSLHVGSNRISRFHDFTPSDFSKSLELQARARKWIRRELQVFDFLSVDAPATITEHRRRADNAEFLLLYIVSILKTVDIKGSSGKAEGLVKEYLGEENAKLFLHELGAWLRTPYVNLEDWDKHVQYSQALPTFAERSTKSVAGRDEILLPSGRSD